MRNCGLKRPNDPTLAWTSEIKVIWVLFFITTLQKNDQPKLLNNMTRFTFKIAIFNVKHR